MSIIKMFAGKLVTLGEIDPQKVDEICEKEIGRKLGGDSQEVIAILLLDVCYYLSVIIRILLHMYLKQDDTRNVIIVKDPADKFKEKE